MPENHVCTFDWVTQSHSTSSKILVLIQDNLEHMKIHYVCISHMGQTYNVYEILLDSYMLLYLLIVLYLFHLDMSDNQRHLFQDSETVEHIDPRDNFCILY